MQAINDGKYRGLAEMTSLLVKSWPEHERALEASFARRDDSDLAHAERIAQMVIALSSTIDGGLTSLMSDYRFICEIVLKEEIHFRRHESYRLKTFEEANRMVYSDRAFMQKYMNGLLVSAVFWVNHCRCFQHYADTFLPSLNEGSHLLEIGPGHGLLLYLATQSPQVETVTGWDVSQTSLSLSQHALEALKAPRAVTLEERNIFEPSIMAPALAGKFDAIVFSEVLEHLEEPAKALDVLFHLCRSGGLVWINVPANSPAPDHLFLVREPSEAVDLVRAAGFEIVSSEAFVMNDLPLAKAIDQMLTISCVVVGRKP